MRCRRGRREEGTLALLQSQWAQLCSRTGVGGSDKSSQSVRLDVQSANRNRSSCRAISTGTWSTIHSVP